MSIAALLLELDMQAYKYIIIQGLQAQNRIFDLPNTGCGNPILAYPKAFFKSMQKHNSFCAIYKIVGWPGSQKNRKFQKC